LAVVEELSFTNAAEKSVKKGGLKMKLDSSTA
jgi:hypothetical protein